MQENITNKLKTLHHTSKNNCLSFTHPEIAMFWHPKNTILSSEITRGSNKFVWWKCQKEETHQWQTSPKNIINSLKNGYAGCPFCDGRKSTKNLENTQELRCLIHPSEFIDKNISVNSQKVIWWKCPKADDHEWKTSVNVVYNSVKNGNTGCPYCRGLKATKSSCVATKYPKAVEYFHPTKNKITLFDVTPGSNKVMWWKCPKADDHEWEKSVVTIVGCINNGTTGCPYCSRKKIIKSNCLETTHPNVIKIIHPTKNNGLDISTLHSGSHQKIWWKCPVAEDHEWIASICKISKSLQYNNKGCPACLNKKLVKSNCLATTHPNMAKLLHPSKNGSITAYDVFAGSEKIMWWQCPNNHEWQSSLYCVLLSFNRGYTGCPHCLYKNEGYTFRCLEHLIKTEIVNQKMIIMSFGKIYVDFYFEIGDQKYIVEYNGLQHYKPIEFFGGIEKFKQRQIRDENLRIYCKENNINLLEIDGRKYYKEHNIFDYLKSYLLENNIDINKESYNYTNKKCNISKFIGENNPFYGKKHSPESRARMSLLSKLRCQDPNWVAPLARKPISDETREKMRMAKLNRPYGKIS